MYQNILVEKKDGIERITVNRPQALNALNSQTRGELAQAFLDAQKDDAVKVVIITGAGDRAFTAGQDLEEAQQFNDDLARQWIVEHDKLYAAMLDLEKPLIARVNGVATGAGLQLGLLADIIIASENARFGAAEINIGIPCITGSGIMWHMISRHIIAEIIMTGRLLTAHEADKIGLINHVVPHDQLEDTVMETARLLATKPSLANALNKRWLRHLTEKHFEEVINYASEFHGIAYGTGEPQKLMKAFFEERARRKQAT